MKPQCNTSAECLRELARVMEQFGITDVYEALKSKYCKWSGGEILNPIAALEVLCKHPDLLTCAIAEVEGKPVFIGDALYIISGEKFVPIDSDSSVKLLCDENGNEYHEDELTWNPSKPKTVLVELTIEDAEFEAGKRQYNFEECIAYAGRKEAACKSALEKLKCPQQSKK